MIDIYQELLRMKTSGEDGVLITVVEKVGHGPAEAGAKILVPAQGKRLGTVGGGALEYVALQEAAEVLESKKATLKRYILGPEDTLSEQEGEKKPGEKTEGEKTEAEGEKTNMLCGGLIILFFEYIGSVPYLYLFGAGHVGKALLYHLKPLDYYITLIDKRAGAVEKLDGAQERFTLDYSTALGHFPVKENSYFIIATHSHEFDYITLKQIYQSGLNPRYIGVMASRRKQEIMIKRLQEDLGTNINLDILFQPVGLDIGGPTPDEIAISIIAEMQAIRYHKPGHRHMKIQ